MKAVVTGANGGLGSAICTALTAAGYEVIATDVDTSGGAIRLDVTDADACVALAAQHGDLDLWVNNAGILLTGPTWELDAARRRRMVDINLHGTVNGTLAALSVMRPRRQGHVINIVSLAGLAAPPGEVMYAATKHAALGFSLGTLGDLRAAGERDLHVSAICPDGIWTPMLYNKVDDPEAASSWSGVLLMPEQVARRVVRLAARPRPVTSIPGWRGGLARFSELSPRAAQVLYPLVMRQARRKQAKFARSQRASP